MDTLIGLLQNPLVLTALGVIVKFAPKVRTLISNRLIPYINMAVALLGALLALMTQAVGPDAAPAVFAVSAGDFQQGFMTAGFFSFLGGEARSMLGAVGSAIGSAAQAYLLNRILVAEWLKRPDDSRR